DCTGAPEAYEQYDGNIDGVRMAMYDASADEAQSLLGAASDDMANQARQDLWERHQEDREQCLPEETRTVQEQMDDMAEFIWNDPDLFPEGVPCSLSIRLSNILPMKIGPRSAWKASTNLVSKMISKTPSNDLPVTMILTETFTKKPSTI